MCWNRALASMTAQLAQLRAGGAASVPVIPESQQLTLTYCSPSLVLNGAQVSKHRLLPHPSMQCCG